MTSNEIRLNIVFEKQIAPKTKKKQKLGFLHMAVKTTILLNWLNV